jgi:hypothetical protein
MKKTKIVFTLNSLMTLLSFIVLMKSIDTGEKWRIICAAAGLAVFLGFTITILTKGSLLNQFKNGR